MTTWQPNDAVRRDGGAEVAEFIDAPHSPPPAGSGDERDTITPDDDHDHDYQDHDGRDTEGLDPHDPGAGEADADP
jgi:hypothetical protein